MPGSGKSTVCTHLRSRGFEAHDLESLPDMFTMIDTRTGIAFQHFENDNPDDQQYAHWRCNIRPLVRLLSEQSTTTAFYCGIAANLEEICHLFNRNIVLQISDENLRAHLKKREGTSKIGHSEAGRNMVLSWRPWWNETIHTLNPIYVDANADPDKTVDTLLTKIHISRENM